MLRSEVEALMQQPPPALPSSVPDATTAEKQEIEVTTLRPRIRRL